MNRPPVHFLYPSSPLRARLPDEQFAPEVEAIRGAGFETSVFSLEGLQTGEFHPLPAIPEGKTVLYRGWMMSAGEYSALIANLSSIGAQPLVPETEYLSNHHLPNWYPKISDLTPETRIFSCDCDLETELRTLPWPGYFIKDYVKSLKTSAGSRITKPEQVSGVVADMQKFRGTIEGGFCVRRIEEFLADTERRYFVIDGTPHAPIDDVPPIVHECSKRISSRFYSVDVVQRRDGNLRIVEIGDGQVSDLVGWTPARFAAILAVYFS